MTVGDSSRGGIKHTVSTAPCLLLLPCFHIVSMAVFEFHFGDVGLVVAAEIKQTISHWH